MSGVMDTRVGLWVEGVGLRLKGLGYNGRSRAIVEVA